MSKKIKTSLSQNVAFVIAYLAILLLIVWICIAGYRQLEIGVFIIPVFICALIVSSAYSYYLAPKYKKSFIFAALGAVLITVLAFLIFVFVGLFFSIKN